MATVASDERVGMLLLLSTERTISRSKMYLIGTVQIVQLVLQHSSHNNVNGM